MYNKIWSPLKQEFVETLSYEGKRALKMYVNSFMTGGVRQKVVTEGIVEDNPAVQAAEELDAAAEQSEEAVQAEAAEKQQAATRIQAAARGSLARQEKTQLPSSPPPPLVELNKLDHEQIENAANSIFEVALSPTEENLEGTIGELSKTITNMKTLNQNNEE